MCGYRNEVHQGLFGFSCLPFHQIQSGIIPFVVHPPSREILSIKIRIPLREILTQDEMPESFSCENGHSSPRVHSDSPIVLYHLFIIYPPFIQVSSILSSRNALCASTEFNRVPSDHVKKIRTAWRTGRLPSCQRVTDKRLSVIISFLNPL